MDGSGGGACCGGRYSVHSPAAVGAAWLSWGVLAGIVPFLFFVFQKQGYGIEYGGKRSAVHLIWWICFMISQQAVALAAGCR